MEKHVMIKFYTKPRRYEKDMERAKAALMKAGEAGMEKGEVTINGVEVKIENVTRGMC